MSRTWKRWQDWAIVVIGVLLFLTPFALGAAMGSTVAWTAWIGGVLLVIVGLWSLASPGMQISEWIEGIIGVLLFIAPWVLGFSGLITMAWAAWIAGILAIILAAWVLYGERGQQAVAV